MTNDDPGRDNLDAFPRMKQMADSSDILTTDYQAFWSYVHSDDDAEGGRIVDLATDLRKQYEMQTGEKLNIFIDREGIEWGNWWREQVDTGLASALFIAILTPRYFLSKECRRELQKFVKQATKLGVRELVLPILYVDVPTLHDDEPDDDLVRLVKDLQWEDWRDLRFSDRTDSDYRRAVAGLAERLVRANRLAEQQPTPDADSADQAKETDEDEEDEAPGVIDKLAASEQAMTELGVILQDVTAEINTIGDLVKSSTSKVQDTAGKSAFGHRIVIAKRLANALQEPADRIFSLGNRYTTALYDVDVGIRVIFELVPAELKEGTAEPSDIGAFIVALRALAQASDEGLGQIGSFVDQLEGIERLSRDLRPVMRTLRKGLTLFVEGRDVIESWAQLADESGLENIAPERSSNEDADETGGAEKVSG